MFGLIASEPRASAGSFLPPDYGDGITDNLGNVHNLVLGARRCVGEGELEVFCPHDWLWHQRPGAGSKYRRCRDVGDRARQRRARVIREYQVHGRFLTATGSGVSTSSYWKRLASATHGSGKPDHQRGAHAERAAPPWHLDRSGW